MDDDSIRYYACLAIAVMVSNKEIEACVLKSGTLSLVLPFIDAHDPQEFAVMDTSHQHGRSSGWLRRLVPVLSSKREEAQALAAFPHGHGGRHQGRAGQEGGVLWLLLLLWWWWLWWWWWWR